MPSTMHIGHGVDIVGYLTRLDRLIRTVDFLIRIQMHFNFHFIFDQTFCKKGEKIFVA
jgi:hypothetical protein